MSDVNTALPPEEVRGVLRRWGIAESIDDIVPGSGTANAGAIVTTPGGRLMLRRRNPRYAQTAWVRFDHALLQHLASDGLPVPRGVSDGFGRTWLHDGARVYELFEFIEGTQHREGDAGELFAAGEVLARLHRSAAGFEPPVEKPWSRFHDPKDACDGLNALLGAAAGNDAAVLKDAVELARKLVERLPDEVYWSLPQTIVQGDYHPANLKFAGGEVAGVFDWDWASRQPRMVDLADGLLFFCGAREAPLVAGDIWSLTASLTIAPERVSHFLTGYQAVLEPTAEERRTLPDLMRCRWLYCRVDAARRKVEPPRQVEFVTRDLRRPLDGIDELEAKLRES